MVDVATDPAPDPETFDRIRARNSTHVGETTFVDYFQGSGRPALEATRQTYPTQTDSLSLDWAHLAAHDLNAAWRLVHKPDSVKPYIRDALRQVGAESIASCEVRPVNLHPAVSHRVGDLRERHLGQLVGVRGEVVHVEPVEPWLREAAFECYGCGTLTRVPQSYGEIMEPVECDACDEGNDWYLHRDRSELLDFQAVIVERADSALKDPPTQVAYLTGEVVGNVGLDDEVVINGVFDLLPIELQDKTRLSTVLEAWSLEVEHRGDADALEAEELDDILLDVIDERAEAEQAAVGANEAAVVDGVVDEHEVRRKEVERRLETLEDDRTIARQAGRVWVESGR